MRRISLLAGLSIAMALAALPAVAYAAAECVGAPPVGTDNIDTIMGTAGPDVIDGRGGGDTIYGGGGDDIICGGSGNDTIYGDSGNDLIIGEGGNDTINGGADADTASYSDHVTPVVALLPGGPGGEVGEADSFVSIENLVGGTGGDTLTGDLVANVLSGGAGNDTLNGGAGDDTLVGGIGADALDGMGGIDIASYVDRPGSVSVIATLVPTPGIALSRAWAARAAARGGGASGEGDVYYGVEGLTGGAGPDVLTGDDGANQLRGGAGIDLLVGAGGSDGLDGGPGSDNFDAGDGDDALEARDGEADASFICGAGADTLFVDVPADDAVRRSECELQVPAVPVPVPVQDGDGDGVADAGDNCPSAPNAGQADGDRDGIGDACDAAPDRDKDTILDAKDNCPDVANAGQADADADAIGDACETLAPGNRVPVAGVSAVVRVLSGEVFVKLPAQGTAAGLATRAAELGPGFVPLKGQASVPVGSSVDTRTGRVSVRTAAEFPGRPRRTQTGTFSAGIFQIKQERRRARKSPRKRPRTDVRLVTPGGGTAVCNAGVAPNQTKGLVRSLSVVLKGQYRALGATSIATVTNATLTVKDRCDGTLTQVGRGIAKVYDQRRRRTVTVRAGQAYFARGRKFNSVKGRPALAARARAGAGGGAR